jgi:D-glycero-D-manno-heptose 1,7-bisphosphate phosphatase
MGLGHESAGHPRFLGFWVDHIRKMQDRIDRLQSMQSGLQPLSRAAQRQARATAVAIGVFGHPGNQCGPAFSSGSSSAENALGRGPSRRPAVFLDRDGTLNHDIGYVHRIADFRWIAGAVSAIRRLNESGYYVFIVTNQSGVAQGIYDETAIHDLHRWMGEELRAAGARVDDIRYCPHHPQASIAAYRVACSCRKPAAGMLLDLMSVWPVIREASIMIGDKESDAAAGRAAGIDSAIVPAGSLEHFVGQLLSRRKAACPPA